MRTLTIWIDRYKDALALVRRQEAQIDVLKMVFDEVMDLLSPEQLNQVEAILRRQPDP